MPLGIPYQLFSKGLCGPCRALSWLLGGTKKHMRFDRLEDDETLEEDEDEDGHVPEKPDGGWGGDQEMHDMRIKVQEYVEQHLEDAGAEERWRAAARIHAHVCVYMCMCTQMCMCNVYTLSRQATYEYMCIVCICRAHAVSAGAPPPRARWRGSSAPWPRWARTARRST